MSIRSKSVLVIFTFLILANPVSAQWGDWDDWDDWYDRGGWNIDRDDLDDDPVEKFPIPVLFGVEFSDINPDFGDSRGDGTREHEGEDFIAPQGTPVVSPTEAIVIRTGTGASSGKYVYTANPGGETFRYMHLDEIADLERGDELDVGDFIGTVGDTGNALSGSYHLHFEVRDDDNDPTDPYERLGEAFSVKDKMSFLRDIYREIDGLYDEDEYAEFLTNTFPDDFAEALAEDYRLPEEIEDILEDSGVDERVELMERLREIIKTIPSIVTGDLAVGDQSTEVSLVQTFLLFNSEGAARDRLAGPGATGYYGPITKAAMTEYQDEHNLEETGTYNQETRDEMLD